MIYSGMKKKDKIKIDKSLDKYDNKVLFPEKVKAAEEMLKNLKN